MAGQKLKHSFLTLIIAVALSCSPTVAVASESSGVPDVPSVRAKLKRHQSKYWIWYSPSRWVAAKGSAGIVVSSPDRGRRSAGVGFSGSGFPVSHSFVFSYLKASGGLDSHPLGNVRIIRRSRKVAFGGGSRQQFEWTARRSDLREKVRGRLKIDVFTSFGYGFMVAGINAPNSSWRRDFRLLKRVAGAIFYRPQAIDPWDPPGKK